MTCAILYPVISHNLLIPSRVFLVSTVHRRMPQLRRLSKSAFQPNSRGHRAVQSAAAGASARWELVHDSLYTETTFNTHIV